MRIAALVLMVAGCCGWLSGQAAEKPLPDAPRVGAAEKISASGELPAILAAQMTRERLAAGDKFRLYAHQAFGPLALLPPAVSAGWGMANPPAGFPHEWKTGGGGYGRLYGDALARRESQQAAQFVVGALLREDPRYLPAEGRGALGRVAHAVGFVLVDKSDSGRNMPAIANFAGVAANGFVANAYLPRGFNDATHAGQQSAVALGWIAVRNLANAFCPEWGPWMTKLHLPLVHPPCGERMKGR